MSDRVKTIVAIFCLLIVNMLLGAGIAYSPNNSWISMAHGGTIGAIATLTWRLK